MKTTNLKTVSLFLIIAFLGIFTQASSQEGKAKRHELKEARKAQLEANFAILDSLLKAKSFVLVADYLQNDHGDRVIVTPTVNFIKVNGSNGILQTGFNTRIGYNGVGGVTAEGTIGVWDVTRNYKQLSYFLHFTMLTTIGNYDIFMNVTSDNFARATISGLGHGKLTWEGHLETVGNARVFKGQTVY